MDDDDNSVSNSSSVHTEIIGDQQLSRQQSKVVYRSRKTTNQLDTLGDERINMDIDTDLSHRSPQPIFEEKHEGDFLYKINSQPQQVRLSQKQSVTMSEKAPDKNRKQGVKFINTQVKTFQFASVQKPKLTHMQKSVSKERKPILQISTHGSLCNIKLPLIRSASTPSFLLPQESQQKKLQLQQQLDQKVQRVSLPSNLDGFQYKLQTRDQFCVKHLQTQNYSKIKTQSREIRGVVAAKQGQWLKAKQLLQGQNLVVCLLELGEFQQAYLQAQEIGFTQAIDYIANKQHRESFLLQPNKPKSPTNVKENEGTIEEEPLIVDKEEIKKSSSVSGDQSQVGELLPSALKQTPNLNSVRSEDLHKFYQTQDIRQVNRESGLKTPFSVTNQIKNEFKTQVVSEQQNQAALKPPLPPKCEEEYRSPIRAKSSNVVKQVQDLQTSELVSNIVHQSFADIERFCSAVGGQNKMDKFIVKYASEWRSGYIQKANKDAKRKGSVTPKVDPNSAYEMSKEKYPKYKATINLLVDYFLKSGFTYKVSSNEDLPIQSQFRSTKNKFNEVSQQKEDSYVLNPSSFQSPLRNEVIKEELSQQDLKIDEEEENEELKKLIKDFDVPAHLEDRWQKHMKTVHTIKVETPRLDDLMRTEQSKLELYESHKALRELNRLHNDPFNERADKFIMRSKKVRDNYQARMEIDEKVKKLTSKQEEGEPSEERNFEEEMLYLRKQKQELSLLYDRVNKETATEIEAIKNEEVGMLHADSAIYEPDQFWPRVDIVYKTIEKEDDLFRIDDQKQAQIFQSMNEVMQKLTDKLEAQKEEQKPVSFNASANTTILSQLMPKRQQNQDILKNFIEWVRTEMVCQQDDQKHAKWLQKMFDKYSVSEVIFSLLQTRLKNLEKDKMSCLEMSKQPLSSILLLIREEFLKMQNLRQRQSSSQEHSNLISPNIIANSVFGRLGFQKTQRKGFNANLLSKMLSRINYFSHFDTETRKKLIEISQYSIYRAGQDILHSDDLQDKILVVISGAVSVYMKDKDRPDDLKKVRHTLYPGDSIGDAPLRLILTNDKLYFYLRAAIESDVLLIKKQEIPQILSEEIISLLDDRIMPLQQCSLFAGEDHQSPYTIFVLANLVTVREYQYGEVIQRQGTQADDSMYLVVRGYAKAIYESTLTKQEPPQPLPRFACGKQTYGEIGVIQQHLNCVDPSRLIKNVSQDLLPTLQKIRPDYFPPATKKKKKRTTVITQKSIKLFEKPLSHNYSNDSQKTHDGSSPIPHEPILFDTDTHQQHSKDLEIEETSPQCTNRTQRLKDQEALIGHQNPKVMETEFKFKQKKNRIIENMKCQVEPEITNLQTFKRHHSALQFTEDKDKLLKNYQAQKEVKLTAHIDVVQHESTIGVGQIFCSRALLEQERSINNLKLCLQDFWAQIDKGKKESHEKHQQKEDGKSIFEKEKKRIQEIIAKNDNKIPSDVKKEIGMPPEKQKVEQVTDTQAEQTSLEQKDPIWQQIFLNLKNLLGDQEIRKHNGESLFKVLNSSQLTIVADSSDLVLLCIKQKNLEQLSEPVRRRIEREIKEQLFVDYDRPFTTKEAQESFVSQYKSWFKQRQSATDQVVEAKRNSIFQGVNVPCSAQMVEEIDEKYGQIGKYKKCLCERCKQDRKQKKQSKQKHDFLKQNEQELKDINYPPPSRSAKTFVKDIRFKRKEEAEIKRLKDLEAKQREAEEQQREEEQQLQQN